jgi:hypothetical protein
MAAAAAAVTAEALAACGLLQTRAAVALPHHLGGTAPPSVMSSAHWHASDGLDTDGFRLDGLDGYNQKHNGLDGLDTTYSDEMDSDGFRLDGLDGFRLFGYNQKHHGLDGFRAKTD